MGRASKGPTTRDTSPDHYFHGREASKCHTGTLELNSAFFFRSATICCSMITVGTWTSMAIPEKCKHLEVFHFPLVCPALDCSFEAQGVLR